MKFQFEWVWCEKNLIAWKIYDKMPLRFAEYI